MFTNKYLNLGYISLIAVIFGIVISTSFVNTAQANDEKKLELKIKGMGCAHCATAIDSIISKCSGVHGCVTSYKDGKAVVEIDASKANPKEIIEELKGAGYDVPEWEIDSVYGQH